ncbi:saccharopine dehydrogenase NADP-binding domain-containing protein [Embleya sp. NPDC001921]
MSTVVIIGVGDMGRRLAAGLVEGGRVRRIVVAGRSQGTVDAVAKSIGGAPGCVVEGVRLDALRVDDVAELLGRTRPDLVVQCAALRGPWALADRADATARGIVAAGLGLRLPYQLPVVLGVMRAARAAGHAGPIANLSFPDVTGPILRCLGLAPTLGLGNVGMMLGRVRTALHAARPHAEPPLIRVLGHHSQVFDVMQALEPADPDERCRVYLDEDGRREDALAYRAPALAPGVRYNPVTSEAALPVLEALLPGAAPLRWSTPAPNGLPGGYPVRIADGSVTLDLPTGVTAEESIMYNERMGRRDGVERIDEDGTVHFTAACHEAVADFAPDLAEPLPIADLRARAARLDAVLA